MTSLDISPAKLDILRVVAAVRAAVGKKGAIALHEPEFCGKERDYVLQCIDSTFVSSVGEFVNRFETMIATVSGARYAIACINGTAALQICLQLAGVRPNDEVLMQALNFVATANVASYLHAVPHFVDSDIGTLGMSATALTQRLEEVCERHPDGVINKQSRRRIAAIVPMHTFGHPVDIEGILAVAKLWNLPVIEDAAESLGSLYHGRHTGTFGMLAALSFNGNKIVTTGGGGAILTNDEQLARHAKHLTTTAKAPHRWAFYHDEIGYNYRLPNLNAALGCAQLERLDHFVESKRRLADRYALAFQGVTDVSVFSEPKGARSNYWLNSLVIDQEAADERDLLLSALNDAGLQARPAWMLLHHLPMYRNAPHGDLKVAERLGRCIVNVPSSAILGDD